MAFEFVGDWTLTIQATRYELETSKLTSIDRGLVRIVALDQGELSVQAIYRMRSARQRLAIRLPDGHRFDSQPLRINGKVVTPEKDSATTIYAPLVDQSIDQTFVLELRYSVDGRPSQLDLPSFPDDPAVQKVYLCAYLLAKTVLISSDGPWSDEKSDSSVFDLGYSDSVSDEWLIQWVAEGITSAVNSAQTFPIGKSQLFVYSTLRPEDAPDGSLRLTTMDRKVFNGIVIAIIVMLGLALYGRSLRYQISLLLLIAVALLLIGLFLPELARTVFSNVFWIALGVVLLIWFIGHVNKLRRLTRSTPPPPSSPPPSSPFAEGEAGASESARE